MAKGEGEMHEWSKIGKKRGGTFDAQPCRDVRDQGNSCALFARNCNTSLLKHFEGQKVWSSILLNLLGL
jgi:hypothetical protein